MKKKVFITITACLILLSAILVGCGNHDAIPEVNPKKGLDLSNYIDITVKGYNGYGVLDCFVNIEQLKVDCSEYMNENYTVNDFADAFSSFDRLFDIDIDKSENLSNGDKVTIDISSGSLSLSAILSIDVNYEPITYVVKDLKEYKAADDIFQRANFSYQTLAEVDGQIGYVLISYGTVMVELPNGTWTDIVLDVECEDGQVFKAGDTVHVKINEEYAQRYIDEYGEDLFSKTEGDVKLERMAYLPSGGNAKEFFDIIDDECLNNASIAMKRIADDLTDTETTVERVGMMLYFDDEGKLSEDNNNNKWYNQLVVVYKITNDLKPDGWYSYLAYNGAMAIGYRFDKATLEYAKVTCDLYGSHLTEDFRYYYNEQYHM